METVSCTYPKISIVTVAYNCREVIERTILSVVHQDYDNFEYVVIDGGSNDGTVNIIRQYEQYMAFWSSERDRGIYDAMNKSLAHVTGDWVIFMNAGDTFAADDVLTQVFVPNRWENVGVVYGDINQFYEGMGSFVRRYNGMKASEVPLNICHQACFTRSEVLNRYGFDLTFRICADADSFLRMSKEGIVFEYVPVVVANFDATDGCSSVRFVEFFKERCQLEGTAEGTAAWKMGFAKAMTKNLIYRLIPKKLYVKCQYMRLRRKNKYQGL